MSDVAGDQFEAVIDCRRSDLDISVREGPPFLLKLSPDLSERTCGRNVKGEYRNRG